MDFGMAHFAFPYHEAGNVPEYEVAIPQVAPTVTKGVAVQNLPPKSPLRYPNAVAKADNRSKIEDAYQRLRRVALGCPEVRPRPRSQELDQELTK